MVLKALNARDVVIHDMKLIGNSTVAHQIDVTIQRDGVDRRILIECKDFDLRGVKVGLDIVRSFRSVIEDTGVDEAVIVTCNGFTEPAEIFAKAKGIRLAVLRAFEEADREGRLQKIVLRVHLRGIICLDIDQLTFDPVNHAQFDAAIDASGLRHGIDGDSPIHFVRGDDSIQFQDFLHRRALDDAGTEFEGERVMRILPDGWRLSVAGSPPIAFEALDLRYVMANDTEISEITSDRIAELILADLEGRDTIIYADQLATHRVGPHGRVS